MANNSVVDKCSNWLTQLCFPLMTWKHHTQTDVQCWIFLHQNPKHTTNTL